MAVQFGGDPTVIPFLIVIIAVLMYWAYDIGKKKGRKEVQK